MKLILAIGLTLSAFGAQAGTLYSNGPVVNGSGLSLVTAPAISAGFATSASIGYLLADNFTVTGAGWSVASLDFYGYQTSASGYTFTSVTWSVLGGTDINTATLVASGTTAATNGGLMGYRALSTTPGNTTRAIYKVSADVPDFTLAAGNYWLTWGLSGTGASGPWTPPVLGSLGAGNAYLHAPGALSYEIETDAGTLQTVELPFEVNGSVMAVPEPASAALMLLGVLGLCGATRRRTAP